MVIRDGGKEEASSLSILLANIWTKSCWVIGVRRTDDRTVFFEDTDEFSSCGRDLIRIPVKNIDNAIFSASNG